MRRTTLLLLLCAAVILTLLGCNRNINTEQDAGSDEIGVVDTLSDNGTPESPTQGDATGGLPNWANDFTDGFIPLGKFAEYLAAAGSSFGLLNTNPIEFSNGQMIFMSSPAEFVLAFDVTNAQRNAGLMGDGIVATSIGFWSNWRQESDAISLHMATCLWYLLADADEFMAEAAFTGSALEDTQELMRFNEVRSRRQNRMLATYHELESVGLQRANTDMIHLGSPLSREANISPAGFNAVMREKNTNFQSTGATGVWSNGCLTIEVVQDERGCGIAVYDGSGTRIEVFDDSGWYAMNGDGSMSYALVSGLWSAIVFADAYASMEPLFVEGIYHGTAQTMAVQGKIVAEMFPDLVR